MGPRNNCAEEQIDWSCKHSRGPLGVDAPGGVAVIGYSFWQSRLHGDPHVVGANVQLDRQPYIVIGVMPRNFEFPLRPGHLNHSELWVPMSFAPSDLEQRGGWDFQMVGRLKPNVTLEQAQADADQVAGEIMRSFPSFQANIHITADCLRQPGGAAAGARHTAPPRNWGSAGPGSEYCCSAAAKYAREPGSQR